MPLRYIRVECTAQYQVNNARIFAVISLLDVHSILLQISDVECTRKRKNGEKCIFYTCLPASLVLVPEQRTQIDIGINSVIFFFMVASGGVVSEGYGLGGIGVCLGDGQPGAEGVPLQCGRGDALLRRMPPYLT